jgi:RNA polymerase sigma-70 factor (ECF subfamily)
VRAEPAGESRLSDEALLAGLAAGDGPAARAFVRRYQSRVFGLAASVLGDRSAAEDVAQEAFVRAWRHASAYDPRRGTVTAWLLRITRNLAIDVLRLRRADVLDPHALAGLDARRATPSTEDAAIIADDTSRVGEALRRLPAEQSRALLQAAFYGRTAEEISQAERIPLGTAKTRIRLGLRKLRDHLSDEPAEAAR